MKVTIVPAQITTVEDKIAGNLGMIQICLLVAPIFIDCVLYAIVLPLMHATPFKVILSVLIDASCFVLAVRVKGRVVLFWVALLLRYNLRPRYYVNNKNAIRSTEFEDPDTSQNDLELVTDSVPAVMPTTFSLTVKETIRAIEMIEHSPMAIQYGSYKRGGMYVRFTEVEK